MNAAGLDYAERSGAAFLPTFEANVVVPICQSIVSGLFIGVPISVIFFIVLWAAGGSWRLVLAWGCGSLVVVSWIRAWWYWHTQVDAYDSLLWYQELAKAPEQADTKRQVYDARVRVNNHWKHCDLPFDRDNPGALVSFARGVICGAVTFSDEGAKQSGYSVRRFGELRDGMMKNNVAYWKNPNSHRAGIGLTRGGIALLKSVAENPPSDDYEPDQDDWAMSPEMIQK